MKAHKLTGAMMAVLLLAPSLYGAKPKPWDEMDRTYYGTITIVMQNGEKLKAKGSASFAPSAVTIGGRSIARKDIKEVVIRGEREFGWDVTFVGTVPFLLMVGAIKGDHKLDKGEIAQVTIASPFIVALAAVTAPLYFIIHGVQTLKPAKLLYKVVP